MKTNNSIKKPAKYLKEDIKNKHMKRCSTSYAIRELQIKMTMRYHYVPDRVVKIQNIDNTKSWRRYGKTGTLICCW